jgi:hypothetical protein
MSFTRKDKERGPRTEAREASTFIGKAQKGPQTSE